LEQLQQNLQENMTIYISRCQIQRRKHLYFISINQPTFNKPTRQQEENPCIIIPHRNQLNDRHRRLLQHLVHEREGGDEDIVNEYPPVENNDAANILLELREVYNNNNGEEPMLVDDDEEEEVDQAQQPQPYQLTSRYIEQLHLTQQQLEPWLADCHVRYWERFENDERAFFEQQQHLEEEEAVVVLNEVVEEEAVANEVIEEEEAVVDEIDDHRFNNNIIIDNVVMEENDIIFDINNGDDDADNIIINIPHDNAPEYEEEVVEEDDEDVEEDDKEEEEAALEVADQHEHIINYAINLPVVESAFAGHRQRRNDHGLVALHNKKQFDHTSARALACLYATYLTGWKENSPRREKEQIALASCTLVCYNLGYKIIMGKFRLVHWLQQFKSSVLNTSALNVFNSKHKGSTNQTTRVEMEHPTYLRELYRRAINILGDDTTFSEIAAQMNLLSTVEERPTINLKKDSLRRWF
jgi:hypothetical protein